MTEPPPLTRTDLRVILVAVDRYIKQLPAETEPPYTRLVEAKNAREKLAALLGRRPPGHLACRTS